MKNLLLLAIALLTIAGCVPSQNKTTRQASTDGTGRERTEWQTTAPNVRMEIARQIADSIARADSTARAGREEAVRSSIKIISYYTSSPNSAGGVDVYFRYTNLNEKIIKYLTWEAYPMNAVGDMVASEIAGLTHARGKDTGPVKKGQSGGGCWGTVWYNHSIKKMILTSIEIEYMDGSELKIDGDDLYLIGKKRE